jgi:hypothetical protein
VVAGVYFSKPVWTFVHTGLGTSYEASKLMRLNPTLMLLKIALRRAVQISKFTLLAFLGGIKSTNPANSLFL